MSQFIYLIKNFFTHKDFLPPANELPGTLFTPLHFIFASIILASVIALAFILAKKSERSIKKVFTVIWCLSIVLEAAKILWETYCGRVVSFETGGVLPLYPCSIFMYAMPLVIWGNGIWRRAGCGYLCTLGILGGAINFVYPANILSSYSCISFAGFHTLFFHGAILFCALTVLISKYHTYTSITKWYYLFVPAIPCLTVSLIANAVNFSKIGSDYMFFKLNSFFLAPIGAVLPDAATVAIVYAVYILIHALPYIPSFIANKAKNTKKEAL